MRGWRGNDTGNILQICASDSEQNTSLENCIDQRTFNKSDIFDDDLLGYSRRTSLLDDKALSIFETFDVVGGKYYTLQLDYDINPNYKDNMLFVLLKYGFVYKFWVHDPKYFALTTNPAYLHFLLEIFDSNKTENYYFNLLLTGYLDYKLKRFYSCHMNEFVSHPSDFANNLFLKKVISKRLFSFMSREVQCSPYLFYCCHHFP